MIQYNDENCEKVARYVAEQMDIERLIEFVTEELYERYEKDEDAFIAKLDYFEKIGYSATPGLLPGRPNRDDYLF